MKGSTDLLGGLRTDEPDRWPVMRPAICQPPGTTSAASGDAATGARASGGGRASAGGGADRVIP